MQLYLNSKPDSLPESPKILIMIVIMNKPQTIMTLQKQAK